MKHVTSICCGIAALFAATSSAHAALALQINPATQRMALIGSSTGSATGEGFDFNPVTFQYDMEVGGDFSLASYSVQPTDNFFSIDRPDVNFSLRIVSVAGSVQLAFLFDSLDELTISGTGVFLDYGSLLTGFPGDASPAERFDKLPEGTLLFVNDGIGFDGGVTVQIIPEPSTAALLGLLGIIPLLRRRRGV